MTQQPPPETTTPAETVPSDQSAAAVQAEAAPPPETPPVVEPTYTVDDLVRAAPTSGQRALVRSRFRATGKTTMTHDEAAAFLQTIMGGA